MPARVATRITASATDRVAGGDRQAGGFRQVWDLPVRLCHWALALGVVAAWATHRIGVSAFAWHRRVGYAVLVLVAFRIAWGVVGTRHARFASFVRGPRATLGYLRGLLAGHRPRSVGHNPLGAWMVLLLLAALGAQATLGLFATDDIFDVGPLYGTVAAATSSRLTGWHRLLFGWIVAAATLHVLAVLAHRLGFGEHLVRAMVTGRKPAGEVPDGEAIGSSRIALALLLVVALGAALAWVIARAPPASLSFD